MRRQKYNITKIYLVTNCYDDPNKVYIGKTVNSRIYEHRQTYGKQIEYTYIDEINSINREDWEPVETYWIQQFMAWGFEVVNIRKIGGSGSEGGHKMPPGFGENLSNKLKGRKCPWVTQKLKGRSRPNISTPIYQKDLNNNVIKEWPSQKHAVLALGLESGTLTACLKGRQNTHAGYKWEYVGKQFNSQPRNKNRK